MPLVFICQRLVYYFGQVQKGRKNKRNISYTRYDKYTYFKYISKWVCSHHIYGHEVSHTFSSCPYLHHGAFSISYQIYLSVFYNIQLSQKFGSRLGSIVNVPAKFQSAMSIVTGSWHYEFVSWYVLWNIEKGVWGQWVMTKLYATGIFEPTTLVPQTLISVWRLGTGEQTGQKQKFHVWCSDLL